MDKYEIVVGQAVAAMRTGVADHMEKAMPALVKLDSAPLVAELCTWVKHLVDGQNVDELLASTALALPETPKQLISAVERNDLAELSAISGRDPIELFISMVTLIASLQEARERAGTLTPTPAGKYETPQTATFLARLFGKPPSGARA